MVTHKWAGRRGIVIEAYADLDFKTLKRKELRDVLWESGDIETCEDFLLIYKENTSTPE